MRKKQKKQAVSRLPGRICASCGSPATSAGNDFCGYCGAELPRDPPPQIVKVVREGPFGDIEARFKALEAKGGPGSDLVAERQAETVRSTIGAQSSVGALLIVISLVGLFIGNAINANTARSSGHVALDNQLVVNTLGVLGFLIGLFFVIRGLKRRRAFEAAPRTRLPVLILEERNAVTQTQHGVHQSHFVILESKGGERREYPVSSSFAGTITAGDMGYATVKEWFLLAFERVDV